MDNALRDKRFEEVLTDCPHMSELSREQLKIAKTLFDLGYNYGGADELQKVTKLLEPSWTPRTRRPQDVL